MYVRICWFENCTKFEINNNKKKNGCKKGDNQVFLIWKKDGHEAIKNTCSFFISDNSGKNGWNSMSTIKSIWEQYQLWENINIKYENNRSKNIK